MPTKRSLLFLLCATAAAQPGAITRVWLAPVSPSPGLVIVSWDTAEDSDSVVEYGVAPELGHAVRNREAVRLHHVEIPAPAAGPWHYRVRSGAAASGVFRARGWEAGSFRAVIVGDTGYAQSDWPAAVLRERPQLLLTAGDNVPALHQGTPVEAGDVSAFRRLIDKAPELFRTTPYLPALGNHDHEMRPRGPKPPPEPVYDVEATAFRKFFALPGDGWKWSFDVPAFGVRFVALDLHHTSDFGTTWQTGHDFREDSEQLAWYRSTISASDQPFVITINNERNVAVRHLAHGAWWPPMAQSSAVVTGFGYFAERAMVDGVPCVNTSVSGKGDRYPDPASFFLKSEDNYVLRTFVPGRGARLELKSLVGEVLDAISLAPRKVGRR